MSGIAMEYNNEGMLVDPKIAEYANTFEIPKADAMGRMDGFGDTNSLNTSSTDGVFGDSFSSGNIGGTMQGIGSIATAAAGIYDAHNKKKYQDKVFGMEEKRVERETGRQDKQQVAYDKVFG